MKILIFFLFSFSQASSFNPEDLGRDLQRHFFSQLAQGQNPSKYREIDFLFKTQKSLSTSCQIEFRDELQPESCFRLLKLWEQTLNKRAKGLKKSLEKRAQAIAEKNSIREYIQQRKGQESHWYAE